MAQNWIEYLFFSWIFVPLFVFIGPESDHCLPLSLTDWLTNSLLFSKLDWCNPGVWRCQLKTLLMRIVLATICWRFRSWGLVKKLNFCSDFEHKVWSRFWSWSSGMILKLEFVQYFAVDVLWRLWSWILVEILKLGLVNKFRSSREAEVCLRI